MRPDEVWAELKRRRVVRVAIAYAVAVFVVLQVADLTFDPLGLPEWSYRFLLVVAIVGFPVAVALAWAFDVTPDGVRAEPGGSDSPGRGTGRWVVGGAAVVALGVGIWQLAGGPGPAEAEGIDPELIAVMPFRVSSGDDRVTILREGVIDLLSPIFSGSPRTVDTGAMMSAWRGVAGDDDEDLAEGQAVELARRLGAGRAVVGSVVGSADAFTVSARLLSVPDGSVIGVASVDGSSAALRETVSQLAAQILSMEAGVDEGQVDYLADVPLEALEAYLEGRRLYRQARYIGARGAFSRALDVDSTFALAALGAWEAVAMGLDADRAGLNARAIRVLEAHASALPSRDRIFVELLPPFVGERRSAVELVRESGARMVSELPDKAEAWYMYGDQMYHRSWMVAEDDWQARALDAFLRAEALDPGLEVVQEHLFFLAMLAMDTVALRPRAEALVASGGGNFSGAVARATLAYALGDDDALAALREAIPSMTYPQVQPLPITAGLPHVSLPATDVELMFDRMEASAITAADRQQALQLRYGYYRSEGLSDDADRTLRRLEATYGPQPMTWVLDHLYWQGPEAPARDAAEVLGARVGTAGPIPWDDGGEEACALGLWSLRQGDDGPVDGIVRRLREASADPDPAHGDSALCALALQAMAAHQRGSADAGSLLDRFVAALDDGPGADAAPLNLEAAWLLEERGDLEAAARVAGYMYLGTPFLRGESTRHRESGRLWDAAANVERAVERYRWYLGFRDLPDSALHEEADEVRRRLAELGGRPTG